MIAWQRLGRVLVAQGQRPWMKSHTAVPIPLHLEASRYRVYFGTRDEHNHPRIGYVVLDLDDPGRPLELAVEPVLGRGDLGHFDENGVYPGPIVRDGADLLMYYVGRQNGEAPHYYMAIGLARSTDGGLTFERCGKAPLLSRSEHDPWMVSTPHLMRAGDRWHMWYLSGLGWVQERDGALTSRYDIKYASSADGLCWTRDGSVAIPLRTGESNICSPAVVERGGEYWMWYSTYVRGAGYRIGFARSNDAIAWRREDERMRVETPASAWDASAMAYPYVFEHGRRLYMLYSGNGFGRDGFGVAASSLDVPPVADPAQPC